MLQTIVHQITSGSTLAFAILILALILAPRIAEKLRLPAMVGLVLAGMALGPHGIRILPTKEIALSALGNFGLLYLMFSAGLELDLKLFMKMKKAAITFALLSFAIPFTLGIVSAQLPPLQVGGRGADGVQLGLAHAGDVPAAPVDGPVAQPRRRDRRRRDGGDRHVGAAGAVGRLGRR